MSFVEVSPSMLTMLNVLCTSVESAFWSIPAEIAASVVRKTSIVARFGWIMPLPLAMPPRRQVLPPSVNSTATSFFTVSVVMMASAAAAPPSAASPAASAGMPASIGAMSSGWPITPVEATITFSGAMPSAAPVSALICSAISMPLALQVFALPLLQTMACAVPSAMCRFVTVSGAPLTRFVVYTAAACAGTALAISARSRLLWFLRMPQWTPFAVKPFAAHTPPGIVFMKNPSV